MEDLNIDLYSMIRDAKKVFKTRRTILLLTLMGYWQILNMITNNLPLHIDVLTEPQNYIIVYAAIANIGDGHIHSSSVIISR